MTATPDEDAFLHDLIADRYSDDNLRELTFELGVEYDDLPGQTKSAKARELVRLAQRRDELPLLIDCLRAERPAIDWAAAVVPRLPLHERPRGKLIIGLGVIGLLVVMAGLLTWLYYRPSLVWATNAPVDPDALGIAVAELGISADCRRGAAGREASALLYQTLEEQIRSVGLRQRAPLTRVGLICNQEQAIEAGRRVSADLVIWGWVPQSTEGILGQYTFVDPPEGVGAEAIAEGLELLVGGPGQARFYRISGRTESLVRFVLGLVYAKQKEYDAALAMFNRAITIIEGDAEAVDSDSLAVLYTERGKVQAAMDDADEAFVSYRKAESLNPDYIGMQIAFGAYYYSQREWDSARRYFRQAAGQQEPLPAIAYGLGLLEFYAGDYPAALAQFQEAVERTLALDEEPILPWLAMGYAYSALGDCPASDAAFVAIVNSETAEDEIRTAAKVETGRCGRAQRGQAVVQPVGDTSPVATIMPTAVAAAATAYAYAELAMAAPAPVTICALRPTELRAGPGAEFAAAARLEAGGAAVWDGARVGNWLYVRLAPGYVAWAWALDFSTCAGGSPWAATGVPPIVWPTSVPPLLPTLLATPVFMPTITLLPTGLATPSITPSPTLFGTPLVGPTATQSINVRVSETPSGPTLLTTTPPTLTIMPTLLPTLPPSPPPPPTATETLLPPPPATATARPTATETLLPPPTPTLPPPPTDTPTLLPAPSETHIPSGTGEPEG